MNYWRAKSAQLEYLVSVAQALAKRDAIFRQEGLDPARDYTLSDATETAELMKPHGVLAPILQMPTAADGS